jgi:hypothetical protein
MRTARVGVALSAVTAVICFLIWGSVAVLPAASFGLVATTIQLGAGSIMRIGDVPASFPVFAFRWGIGMGLRLAGIVLLVVALVLGRSVFVPLPTTIGFLGVLIPLLFLEARSLR